jgi:hypothetical protein
MAARLFGFLQLEFPWALGPADGRYVLRAQPSSEPERIVVLSTVGARRDRGARRRTRRSPASAEPAAVPTARATVIDPEPVAGEPEAQAWLAGLAADPDPHADGAVSVINRVMFAHRIASADPYVHEVSARQALVVRAGWGEGEQVAEGRWREALELSPSAPRRARRAVVLRPQERLAVLLGRRGEALLTEELALRARLDLDQGRVRHAALELRDAYAAALAELPAEQRADLGDRLAELERLRPAVEAAAASVVGQSSGEPDESGEPADPDEPDRRAEPRGDPAVESDDAVLESGGRFPGESNIGSERDLDVEALAHALERLQAALRARTASGFH